MDIAALLSSLLGLIYFTAWSLSFYPQPLHNSRRRSTAGTTIAYPLLNLLGFAAYTAYVSAFLFSPVVRAQYAVRHPTSVVPSVSPWDLAFTVHACGVIAVTLSQFWGRRVWGWGGAVGIGEGEGGDGDVLERVRVQVKEEREARRVGAYVWSVFGVGIAGVLAVTGVVLFAGRHAGRDARGWAYIDIIYALSNLKLFVTLTKYVPQINYNARHRSTSGWSILQILLDFLGGIASVLQLFVDAYRFSEIGSAGSGWKDGVMGNMVKFWLGNVSMVFDVVFMVQHYLLYADKVRRYETSAVKNLAPDDPRSGVAVGAERLEPSERQPLLGSEDRS